MATAGGVYEYAHVNARVRAIYSTLITPLMWNDLISATDYRFLISLLRPTDYGPYLLQVDEKDLTPRRAVYQINKQMADIYATVLRVAPEPTCPLLVQYYRNFEVDNLKALLRGILLGGTWDQLRYFLFPLGPSTVLPAQTMVQSGSVSAAVELLRGTPYYVTLSHAMRRYNAEQSLFPLEVALDLNYWRTIWNEINHLPERDRSQALQIVGSLLDVNNLMWAIRYRVYYNLSEEEIINYTLPFGYQVRDADIRAIAAGADIPPVVERIFPSLTDVYSLLLEPRKGLPELEMRLQRIVREHCKKAFLGYPFHIGVPLGYLVLKKMEIQDLIVLIEAKSSGLPVEEFRPFLVSSELPK
jgi:vacuolar-type H+-ATPase subunit C/Vma6